MYVTSSDVDNAINKEIADLEKSLKTQNVEIGANEIVRTTAVAQKVMEELNQAMTETEIKKETNKQRDSRPREKPKNPKRRNRSKRNSLHQPKLSNQPIQNLYFHQNLKSHLLLFQQQLKHLYNLVDQQQAELNHSYLLNL